MERKDVLNRPLRDVLRVADHEDLQLQLDPAGSADSGRWKRKTVPPFDTRITDAAVERMREAWRDDTLLDEGGDALFETRAGVGDKETNGRVDVAKIETLLEASGALDLKHLNGPTGLFAVGKSAAIRDFQRANGLDVDGQVLPSGPTIQAFKAAIQPISHHEAAAPMALDKGSSTDDRSLDPPDPTTISQRKLKHEERIRRKQRDATRPMREGIEGYREVRFPRRAAFADKTGRWPRDLAWSEIEKAKADPGTTIRPKFWETRIWAILNDRKAIFDIQDDPNANNNPADHRDHARGFDAVARHEALIVREAKDQGVDPDLIRAIIYVENADGDPGGLNKLIEDAGLAKSILPMNIKDRLWGGIGGVKREEFRQPERNIRAGVALIKAIIDRLRPEDRTPAKIGSIWNATAAESVNEIGARIQRTYDERTWKFVEDHRE